ncbi:MAG: serine/threonine protein kinase [Kofleriaceae bacterium]|jgi:serine/threonine protein kinase|nr:serine/threonine protein kinase [Kofleriaceae bacterium]MBP6837176.1 serine/threonine protein kinase [Kofleriaceae bacterium]MBP9202512.1 serine/threonine protein kinase [Kofleriaceae bacterium]
MSSTLSKGALIDGKYEIVDIAGEGGMATVYRAVIRGAAGFARTVAVKRIKPEYRALKNYIDMFVEEARVGSDLAHPNIVQVYDFCVDPQGSYYLVMEWVEGLDLGSYLRAVKEAGEQMSWPLVAGVGIGTLRGLGAAHERRRADGAAAPVIHRDVSPHNVLVGCNGVVKLTDFGLARARDRAASLTAPGTVKGKLSYLAPEVSWGKSATPASDLFSMGLVLWEALSGERVFDGKNDLEVFKKIRACDVPPITDLRPDVPAALSDVIARSLAKEPADRHASARDFAYALAEVLKKASLGGDAQQALGAAVVDARRRLGRGGDDDGQVTWNFDVSGAQTRDARPPGAAGGQSIEIDLSAPDLTVDPLPLTKPKK